MTIPSDISQLRTNAAAAGVSLRILVVDDDVGTTLALQELLTEAGHTVRLATSGEQALVVAAAFSPQAILVDLGLPDVDGFELAGRLRASDFASGARLIAITGYARGATHAAYSSGFEACLVKPVDLAVLLATLDRPAVETP